MNEVELLTELVAMADQSYKLQLVALGLITVALGWIAGHQR